jgi:hypothetical protein
MPVKFLRLKRPRRQPFSHNEIQFYGGGDGWLWAIHLPTGTKVELDEFTRGDDGKTKLIELMKAKLAKRK